MSSADDSGPDRLLSGEADLVFKALADHTRRRILVRLAHSPDDAGAVARDLGLSRQGVVKHLRILESGGIVRSATRSSRRVHSVSPSQIREVSDLLGIVAQGWDCRLRDVKAQAERRGDDP